MNSGINNDRKKFLSILFCGVMFLFLAMMAVIAVVAYHC